jgi:hypothetical protein
MRLRGLKRRHQTNTVVTGGRGLLSGPNFKVDPVVQVPEGSTFGRFSAKLGPLTVANGSGSTNVTERT